MMVRRFADIFVSISREKWLTAVLVHHGAVGYSDVLLNVFDSFLVQHYEYEVLG
jgi:hypothetical protein